ncbi:LysR family transcriptional regulator [Pseudomonas brassicacearum]|uniref:LysR family transcriptional regulator n=1 Tax=Pseudomonas brassicacearum TaxID=930166 RepID=UPI000F4A8EBC|nr:LysR family transcriptional regulator [Pseudomonas brassicacearum]
MDKIQEMQAFVVICEELSFTIAARRLSMSPTMMTRAIASLERRLNTLLLIRNTRNVQLSDTGRRFLVDCKRILSELDEAENFTSRNFGSPSGQLTVAAPQMFGERYIMPIITNFLTEHANVTINTLLLDRVTNMIEEGIDVAIRIGNIEEDLQHGIVVGKTRRVICGSADYFKKYGRPSHPSDLHNHRLIASTANTLSSDWKFEADGNFLHIKPNSKLTISTDQAAINIASLGWGLTQVLSYQIADKITAGELEIILDEYEQAPLPVRICFQLNRKIPAKISAFVDLCINRLSENFASGQFEFKTRNEQPLVNRVF